MFAIRDIIAFALVAGILATAVLAIWPWSRSRGRFAFAGIATSAGFIGWNLVLNATNGSNFNVDASAIGLSWADAGSGILAFVAAALVLGLATDRREPANRVVDAAALAGVVAMLVDLFVL